MITGIYKILNKINNKIYIGSATDIKKRWRDHKWHLNHNIHHNPHLQSAWNKYGRDNFEFSIILVCSANELLIKENECVKIYNTLNNNHGYNINDPQKICLGKKCSEETKSKQSKRMLGINNPMYGKHGAEHPKFNVTLSISMRNQMSSKKKGIPTNRRPHSKLTPEDIIIIRKMYNEEKISQPKIAIKYNVCCTTINQIINNKIWINIK
jgi:group I intron endonuclease